MEMEAVHGETAGRTKVAVVRTGAAGQTWLLAVLTLILALPLGLLLAWCLDAVINVQAFGWRLPLQVFPWQLAQLLGLALLATLRAFSTCACQIGRAHV